MKRVTIVNKFGPSSNAITGQNARELADFLHQRDIEVRFVCLKADYQSAAKKGEAKIPYDVKEIRSVYTGRSPRIRFIASLLDGFRLWLKSIPGGGQAVIVMTDPPLLFLWFQFFRRFSRRKLIYWTMDLYPEAFVAGNYISSSNFVYRFFYRTVYKAVPDLSIVLGTEQLKYLEKRFAAPLRHVTVPCGVIDRNVSSVMPSQQTGDQITFGYGGNIGEAHDANFLIALAKQLDPSRHRLIVSLYGSKASMVKEMIASQEGVHFRDFLNLDDISLMDVNVATLLPEWNHICVPSKAVTAICCGSPLLLNASPDADNWRMLQDATWLIQAGTDYNAALKQSLASITKDAIQNKREKARILAEKIVFKKNQAYIEIFEFLSIA